jgi:hypothetical protein
MYYHVSNTSVITPTKCPTLQYICIHTLCSCYMFRCTTALPCPSPPPPAVTQLLPAVTAVVVT